MDKENFKYVLDYINADDIRHIKLERYDDDYLKAFEYHQIIANKEDK